MACFDRFGCGYRHHVQYAVKLKAHTQEIGADLVRKNRRQKSTWTTQKLTTKNKMTKLYKQNENKVIDQSISPVAVVVRCIRVQKSARNRTRNRSAPESGTRKIWYQIGMTHSPEVGADFWTVCHRLKATQPLDNHN